MHEELINEFISSMQNFRKMKEKFPKTADLSHLEVMILNHIYFLKEHKKLEEVRVSDITLFMGVTKPAISHVLNMLEEKGLITRSISQKDRRGILLKLTEKGISVHYEGKHQADLFMERIIEKMGEDNFKKMLELFSLMTDAMEKM